MRSVVIVAAAVEQRPLSACYERVVGTDDDAADGDMYYYYNRCYPNP